MLMLIKFLTPFLTKITAAQNEAALSYHSVRRLYFLAVAFTATIYHLGKSDVIRIIV